MMDGSPDNIDTGNCAPFQVAMRINYEPKTQEILDPYAQYIGYISVATNQSYYVFVSLALKGFHLK
jgi:hypothetical protein